MEKDGIFPSFLVFEGFNPWKLSHLERDGMERDAISLLLNFVLAVFCNSRISREISGVQLIGNRVHCLLSRFVRDGYEARCHCFFVRVLFLKFFGIPGSLLNFWGSIIEWRVNLLTDSMNDSCHIFSLCAIYGILDIQNAPLL